MRFEDTQRSDTIVVAARPALRPVRSRLPRGTWLGDRFQVAEYVDSGGMGDVYRAVDHRDGGEVAVKILRPQLGDRARFEQEATLLARLTHPAIVGYVAHGVSAAGEPYLAMEWLPGETLGRRLKRGPLDAASGLALARGAARALAAAHARGVVHRDVKPDNLFLVGGAVADVKLIDFGVARDAAGTVTSPGTIVGTVRYMAPEQALGFPDIDARADVYALGRTLREAIADLPAPLAAILPAMIESDRDLRPADAAAVLAALGRRADRRPRLTPPVLLAA